MLTVLTKPFAFAITFFSRFWHVFKQKSHIFPTKQEARSLAHHKSFDEAHYQHCWQRYAQANDISRYGTLPKVAIKRAFAAGWAYADESTKEGLK
jgi:hypothetical protein